MATEAAVARTLCGLVRTLLFLVLELLPLRAESLRVEIPVKTQTVNDSIIIICNNLDFLHVDTNTCPVSSLFSEEAKVKKDNDSQYLLCKGSGLFPKDINITWCEWNQNSQHLNISLGITTPLPIENEDNTLNDTRFFWVKLSLGHNETYQCRIEHKPSSTLWRCETLRENGSEPKDDQWMPFWILLSPFAVVLIVLIVLIVAVVLCKRNYCHKQTMRIFIEEETPEAFIHNLALDSEVV